MAARVCVCVYRTERREGNGGAGQCIKADGQEEAAGPAHSLKPENRQRVQTCASNNKAIKHAIKHCTKREARSEWTCITSALESRKLLRSLEYSSLVNEAYGHNFSKQAPF